MKRRTFENNGNEIGAREQFKKRDDEKFDYNEDPMIMLTDAACESCKDSEMIKDFLAV